MMTSLILLVVLCPIFVDCDVYEAAVPAGVDGEYRERGTRLESVILPNSPTFADECRCGTGEHLNLPRDCRAPSEETCGGHCLQCNDGSFLRPSIRCLFCILHYQDIIDDAILHYHNNTCDAILHQYQNVTNDVINASILEYENQTITNDSYSALEDGITSCITWQECGYCSERCLLSNDIDVAKVPDNTDDGDAKMSTENDNTNFTFKVVRTVQQLTTEDDVRDVGWGTSNIIAVVAVVIMTVTVCALAVMCCYMRRFLPGRNTWMVYTTCSKCQCKSDVKLPKSDIFAIDMSSVYHGRTAGNLSADIMGSRSSSDSINLVGTDWEPFKNVILEGTNKFTTHVSRNIGTRNYKELFATHLKVPKAKYEPELELWQVVRSQSYSTCVYNVLKEWQCMHGNQATLHWLIDALIKVDHHRTAAELVNLYQDGGFYMKTSQKRVYPTHTFEEQAASRDQAFQFENPIKDLSVITLRDHEFDTIQRQRGKHARKSGRVSKNFEPARNPVPVREHHRACETKILPHVRRGLRLDL